MPFNTGPIYGQDSATYVDPNNARMPAMYPAITAVDEASKAYAEAVQAYQEKPSFVNNPNGILLYNNVIPAPKLFDTLVIKQGDADIIWQEYYDSVPLVSGTALNVKLFQNPKDNPINGNFTQNARLQGDERFLITSIRFELEADSTSAPMDAVDIKETFRLMYYRAWVLNKPYNDGKGMRFLNPEAPLVVNTTYFQQNPFMSYRLPIQMAVGANQTYYVEVQTTPPTLSGNWRLFCYLTGALYRGVQ